MLLKLLNRNPLSTTSNPLPLIQGELFDHKATSDIKKFYDQLQPHIGPL